MDFDKEIQFYLHQIRRVYNINVVFLSTKYH